jgi:hypothetical protein
LARLQLDETQNTTLAVASLIRRSTPADSAIVVFGMNWSSEIPYYAQRKAFAVPQWLTEYDAVWNDPAAFLGGLRLSAAVYCTTPTGPSLLQILTRADIQQQPNLFKVGVCYLWLPGVNAISPPGSQRTMLPMAFLGQVLDAVPGQYAQAQSVGKCDGSIEAIDNVFPAPQKVTGAGLLPVDGWLAVSAKAAIVPDDVFVTLRASDGSIKYVKALQVPRIDINAAFGQPAMQDVGFSTVIDGTALHGDYVLGLAWGSVGKFLKCQQFTVPVQFGAAP